MPAGRRSSRRLRRAVGPPDTSALSRSSPPNRQVIRSAPVDSERVCGASPRFLPPLFLLFSISGSHMSEHARGSAGKVVEIKGVVDAVFPDVLPGIYNALAIEVPTADGSSRTLIAEVQQHLGDDRVRAVAMDTTDGLSRGVDVVDTGAPISVPVGDATLGRIFNVLGDVI